MIIHKHVISALALVTAQDETRYGLGGIHIDEDGTAVATDGHMLLYAAPSAMPAEEYPSRPGTSTAPIEASSSVAGQTIPIGALTQAAKHIKGRQSVPAYDHVAVTPNETGIRVVAIDGRSQAISDQQTAPVDGTFPVWRNVLPKGAPMLTVTLSARILADLAKAATIARGSGKAAAVSPAVRFTFTAAGNKTPEKGYNAVIGVELVGGDVAAHEIAGVVMPICP
jgi:hypothetical protein